MIMPQEQFDGMNATFHVTEDCNLACRYCYQLCHEPNDLKYEDACKFIDDLLTDPDPLNIVGTEWENIVQNGLVLDFIGGDPLMRVELIEKILRYFIFKSTLLNHKWGKNWRMSISTNGTLFRKPGVKEFMNKYQDKLSIGVSIDGCPEIHDKNRVTANGKGSMDLILQDWEWYKSWRGGCNIDTKATLNKDSIPYMMESVRYLYEEMGITNINMNFIFEDMELEEKDVVAIDEQLEQIMHYVLKHRHSLYFSPFDHGRSESKPWNDPEKGWCGSGAMPTLDVNGKYYPCFRFTPQNMEKPEYDMSVGDVKTGFSRKENFELIRGQTRDKISPDKCKSCDVEGSCAWCIASSFAESGKLYRQTYICEPHKLETKWAKRYWEEYLKLEGKLPEMGSGGCCSTVDKNIKQVVQYDRI